jgi:hypothetical protein
MNGGLLFTIKAWIRNLQSIYTVIFFFQHANAVRKKHADILERIALGEYRRKPPSFSVPETDLPIRENVVPGTW